MKTIVEIHEAQNRLKELINLVTEGNEVILTEGKTPLARLVALSPQVARIPNLHPGAIQVSDDFDDPLPDEFWLGEE
jgi:prevent-host-death family protein